MSINKEYYYFVKYEKTKLENKYQKKLDSITDKVTQKQIKDEHQQKWKEFCKIYKVEYEAFLRVKSLKRMKTFCLFCC